MLRTTAVACALLALALAGPALIDARNLTDSKKYSINLVNTFAKGAKNDVSQLVDVGLQGPDKAPEVVDPDHPQPLSLDPDNPRCDLDHEYAYPVFQVSEDPIKRTDKKSLRRLLGDDSDSSDSKDSSDSEDRKPTKTYQVYVGPDYQVQPVLVAKVSGRKSSSQVAVQGSGISTTLDVEKSHPKRTFCGDWTYSESGRYSWTFTVTNDAEAELYYYVKMAPGTSMETYEKMPVNVDYKHEFTVAGSENKITSASTMDTANRGGKVSITLDNVVAGEQNAFDQKATAGFFANGKPSSR